MLNSDATVEEKSLSLAELMGWTVTIGSEKPYLDRSYEMIDLIDTAFESIDPCNEPLCDGCEHKERTEEPHGEVTVSCRVEDDYEDASCCPCVMRMMDDANFRQSNPKMHAKLQREMSKVETSGGIAAGGVIKIMEDTNV